MSLSVSIGVVGPSGVGKTSLIEKFMNPMYDVQANETPTVRVTKLTRRIELNGSEILVDLWDTVGQERFNSVSRSFYHQKDAIVFVYDIADAISFERMKQFVEDAKDGIEERTVFFVCGNKSDLSDRREVDENEAIEYAHSISASAHVLTATDADQVSDFFTSLISSLIDTNAVQGDQPHLVPVRQEGERAWVGCC